MYQLPGGLEENFRFLLLEVRRQVEESLEFLQKPTQRGLERITGRDDYIDNMKGLIEEKAYTLLATAVYPRKQTDLLRSANIMATNLERMGDFAVNVVRQINHLSDPAFINAYDYRPFFEEVFEALDTVLPALDKADLGLAFRVCQCEFHLDALYKETFDRLLAELEAGGSTGDLITCLFIFRYLERMGDSMLNIGEAIIFALMGERMKIHQYQMLTDSLAASGRPAPISDVQFESIWGTRSGCRIGRVAEKGEGGESATNVIFKEGQSQKLDEERANIERWQELAPGLAPRVFGFQAEGDAASILLEYLEGSTYQEILLTRDEDHCAEALAAILDTVKDIWGRTLRPGAFNAGFLDQLNKRRDDVYRVHPEFADAAQSIGDFRLEPVERLLAELEPLDQEFSCPFTVFIHGDFNINNIIYDQAAGCLHYIDLHRSADSDYVQDVSVLMVSHFRLPVPRSPLRVRIDRSALSFLEFARAFAAQHQDEGFEVRLALGLIRSFFTSTRFELNPDFAKVMHLRALYLMRRLRAHLGRPWSEFKVPRDVLVY